MQLRNDGDRVHLIGECSSEYISLQSLGGQKKLRVVAFINGGTTLVLAPDSQSEQPEKKE